MVTRTEQKPNSNALDGLKTSGLDGLLYLALDVIEPIGPLAAQALWMAQPAASLFGRQREIAQLAQMLEAPDGVESIRRWLDDTNGQTD